MKNLLYIFSLLLLSLCSVAANALDLDTYTKESRLASGRWVKISVPESGLYTISKSQLSKWGFSNPDKVRVYGYGGQRIPDLLSASNYVDDLPMVQTIPVESGDLVFYAVGPEQWSRNYDKTFVNLPNIYTTVGYYFLSDTDDEARSIRTEGMAEEQKYVNTKYIDRLHYEYDRVSPGEAGYLLVGESFKAQPSRKFTFDTATGDSISLTCGIVSNSTFASTVDFIVNGEKLDYVQTDQIPVTTSSTYLHGTHTTTLHKFVPKPASKVEVTVNIANASAMKNCWLDFLSLNVTKKLELAESPIRFITDSICNAVTADKAWDVMVYDVTNPMDIIKMQTKEGLDSSDGTAGISRVSWTSDYSGWREYVVFSSYSKLPTPTYVGVVGNQNIHGLEPANMVIFTLPEYTAQAQRIANYHRNATYPLSVHVINVNDVYNEFASGSADVSALRKCLKMFYDRGEAADSLASLQYALLFGRATYDNRHLTSQFDTPTFSTIPYHSNGERRNQLSDNTAFGTDDFIAMLEDNSGAKLSSDKLLIGVGRIPSRSVDEAKSAVDKLMQYNQKSKNGTWRNSFLFLADDGNNGEHVDQTERMIEGLLATPKSQAFVSKVYVDAYDIIGGSCEGGRQDMYRMLNEGVVWWNYCGHANNHSWTGENMLNFNDINNLYLSKVPVVLAATCDFLRWDSNTVSGGEILYNERYGGNIATISATRPVYISDNGYFTAAVGRAISVRDSDGMLPRIGDIYRNAKNDIRDSYGNKLPNSNRLRYVLMGDPAMQIAMPHNIVSLDNIGNQAVEADAQVTVMALQQVDFKGSIRTPAGNVMEDFNGTIDINIYDAEKSTTTKGVRDDNVKKTFEQHGDKLYSGSAPVVNGRFSIRVAMPGEVTDNFRPATINMFAASSDAFDKAVGVNRDFYVYGLDESNPVDSVAPVIKSMALNHANFREGDIVNESPMLLAEISDNIGINLSSAGIGHQMSLMLDDNRSYNDVSLYFTPSSDGTPSGYISYPLENITPGSHTLRLRVWDTAGNSTSQTITFGVQEGLKPVIFDIYCDANPAKTETNFYVSHDRPDSELSITVGVYNLLGRLIWETTVKGRSDMSLSSPVNWNLCDNGGRRVPRGIYLYRASISTDNGETYSTASRKIAVAAE